MIPTVEWTDDGVVMVNQQLLPTKLSFVTCRTSREVGRAIETMVVRGAPAIGVAAAMGYALGAKEKKREDAGQLIRDLESVKEELLATRPTAVNLAWALDRMEAKARALVKKPVDEVVAGLISEALRIYQEDIDANRAIGRHGQVLLNDGDTVLTHCNAGALATAGYGTALGVIRAAIEAGKNIRVMADETRPFLQGARLTAWELLEDGIPVTLICDSMAGWFMSRGEIQAVVVGADRIAANGDTANKIGTYSVAVLAKENKIPFYIAAPLSTADFSITDGSKIPIEERSADEVTHLGGYRLAPEGVTVRNPAFDVTPADYISAIITEQGVAYPPFLKTMAALARGSD